MTTFEINFVPTQRKVRGEHMPDVSYELRADTADQAKLTAAAMLAREGLWAGYRLDRAREVTPTIPELPRVTTPVRKLDASLWPDLGEQVVGIEGGER